MSHSCYHPECDVAVPPRMLACRRHWFQLPKVLRDEIWRTYTGWKTLTPSKPSQEYLDAIAQARQYWKEQEVTS